MAKTHASSGSRFRRLNNIIKIGRTEMVLVERCCMLVWYALRVKLRLKDGILEIDLKLELQEIRRN